MSMLVRRSFAAFGGSCASGLRTLNYQVRFAARPLSMATTARKWVPTEQTLGDLPLTPGDRRTYPVPPLSPPDAQTTQVLLYSYITVHESDPGFQRGYYTISTETLDGKTQYKYYMNVAKTANTVVNSGNYWLPYGENIKPYVYVELTNAEGTPTAPILSKGKAATDYVGGEVFLTGYNMDSPGHPPQK